MNRIDLIFPGLLNLPTYELHDEDLKLAMPGLHKLLRFATRIPNSQFDIDKILIQCLGLKQKALPYAFAMNTKRQPQLLFRPVHLKADINNAIVFPVTDNPDDINQLINDLSIYFKGDCHIKLVAENLWLMHIPECQPLQEVPHVLTATGKKVTHYLEQARSSLAWYKLFNEMQMFLYQHDINQQRFNSGLPMINSLWCWGGDEYQGESIHNIHWFADDELMNGIGRLYCGTASSIPSIRETAVDTDCIVVDLSLLKSLKGDNNDSVMQVLQQFETRCVQPLIQNSAHEIHLHTGGRYDFQFRPSMAWKFWRKAGYSLVN